MDFSKILPHLVALVAFMAVAFVTFAPEFSGKQLRRGDLEAYGASTHEARQYEEQLGERMNWTGTSFAGMPTYLMSNIREGNQLHQVTRATRFFMSGGKGVFLAMAVCSYLGLLLMGVNPWLSIAGAIGITLATNNIVLWKAGHWTKVTTITYLPIIAGGAVAAFRGRYLLGGVAFAAGLGLSILANHPQMLYYFGITVPIYGVYQLVKAIREGRLPHFAKAAGALVVGLVLAIGAGANTILPTLEYTKATMRGGQVLETPVLQANGQGGSSGTAASNGLEFEYAMQWSNGFKDALSTYAPLAAGGGTRERVKSNTTFGKAMRRAGLNVPPTFGAPSYHGSLPFTEGPIYLGAVVWALFLFGLFAARRALALWLGLGMLLILLMSAGSNLESFNRLLFDNLPLLNKFRTPNSALSISVILMLGLGVVGVSDWIKRIDIDPAAARKQLLYSGVLAGALGALIAIVLPSMLDFTNAGDVRNLTQLTGGRLPDVSGLQTGLVALRGEMFSADTWRSFLYVGLTFGVLFLMFRKTISPLIGALILAGLVTVDFGGVNGRYLSDKDWTRQNATAPPAQASAADQEILADQDPHYRVFNVTGNPFGDAQTSYFHKSIGGYSAVKLRRYQDVIDGYLLQQDRDVINMLNTKYIITPGEDRQPVANRNPEAYGPAWLVRNIETVSSNDAEFAALGTVEDLRNTAVIHEEHTDKVAGLNFTGEGTIAITGYTPQELTYTFSSAAEQLAVFSEVWYGPDLGWEAYVDGEEVDLLRANYILRAARIPAGQHEIKLVFNPRSYSLGVTLSYVCSIVIILGLIAYAVSTFLRQRRSDQDGMPLDQPPR